MDIKSLLEHGDTVPSLPNIYHQFQEAMADPNISFKEIGEIVLTDPSLTARLLRIVNSAYFGFPDKIDNISEAISVVGTNQLSQLLLCTVVIDNFRSIPDSVFNMKTFWKHSIACGLIAREFASYDENLNSENFFIAGMLHDIGQLIIFMQLPELAMRFLLEASEQSKPNYVLEHEELGFDHAELGGSLLEKWNLSEFLVTTSKYHHRPNQTGQFITETSIVYLADILANTLNLGSKWIGEGSLPSLDREAWERVAMPHQIKLSDLKEKVSQPYNELVDMFFQSV
jgi:HD-like signal output (HDOD) protein